MHKSFRLLAPAALLLGAACADLEVTNPNNPDVNRALATPSDVATIAYSSLNSWYLTVTDFEPYMMLQVTADAGTANFGNFGMRFNNLEPRIAYNNSSANSDGNVANVPWSGTYRALGAANDALTAINVNGVEIPGDDATEKAKAAALFTQAASFSHLAMLFDQAFLVDENLEGLPELVPYGEVRTAAMAKWDEFITLTTGKSWSWEETVLPMDVPATGSYLARIANTMAARTLVLTARTGAENAATDWNRVLGYADKGLTGTGLTDQDFNVIYDGNNWFDYIKLYGNLDSWTRVDQRVINRMAPNIPVKFNGLPAQSAPIAIDNRLGIANLPCGSNPGSCIEGVTEDFVYTGTVIGDPARGIYMQSPFYHQRYRQRSFAVAGALRNGPVPYILATENDLMIAEAEARRSGGNLARAAELVNKTRVTRGGLTPVAANQAALLEAIDYERDVELLNTNGLALFDARRFERLQQGTVRHLPVPARELEVLNLPVYTFGGSGPDQ